MLSIPLVCTLSTLTQRSGNGGAPHNSRSVFTPEGKRPLNINGGIYELWRGFFQSVRPSIGKLILNVDTVAAFM